ncbi:MAG: hypothetical protein K0U78_18425 [Actinomycetia bacterium]|nr:hypothetical protein [Actinomycetes bacterium]
MGIHVRPKDPRSRQAAVESFAPAARRVIEAVTASTTALQAVVERSPEYPADPRTAFAAVCAYRAAQAEVDDAIAAYLAWCVVAGLSRSGMARALGVRATTLSAWLAPYEGIAGARAGDLHRDSDGSWRARRIDPADAL